LTATDRSGSAGRKRSSVGLQQLVRCAFQALLFKRTIRTLYKARVGRQPRCLHEQVGFEAPGQRAAGGSVSGNSDSAADLPSAASRSPNGPTVPTPRQTPAAEAQGQPQAQTRRSRAPQSDAPQAGQGQSWKAEFAALEAEIRQRNYSANTLKAYRRWARKFQSFTRSKTPSALTTADVKAFLSDLAVAQKVSASAQNQAFNALLFFFRHVLKREFGKVEGVVRAKQRRYIPVVLSPREVQAVLAEVEPPYDLMVKLLYGCGLRISECLALRVNCLNLDMGVLTIHDGKGGVDRTVPCRIASCRRPRGSCASCASCTSRIWRRISRACFCPAGAPCETDSLRRRTGATGDRDRDTALSCSLLKVRAGDSPWQGRCWLPRLLSLRAAVAHEADTPVAALERQPAACCRQLAFRPDRWWRWLRRCRR
jgi:hypothetical protein